MPSVSSSRGRLRGVSRGGVRDCITVNTVQGFVSKCGGVPLLMTFLDLIHMHNMYIQN